MPTAASTKRTTASRSRLLVMAGAGVIAGVTSGLLLGWEYSAIVGWAVACVVYLAWVWGSIARLDDAATKSSAQREDPTSGLSELLTLLASVASLGAVVILILAAKNAHGIVAVLVPLLALLSVALSWGLVHTLFTLRYARLYFTGSAGGIDFNEKATPRYVDFAYLAFTIGMTYQVSDTDLQNHAIRSLALRHGLLSYVFGAVILAATINLVAGLAG
ncbi:MAG: DUF1345 domain-containing protein [Actinomycetota bacterium]|nr:DUF1345 domain-containing protein [Actinomycetota bacterium]